MTVQESEQGLVRTVARPVAACGLDLALVLILVAGGCAPDPTSTAVDEGPSWQAGTSSPSARPDLVRELRADLAAPRHAADGGGRAWLVDPPTSVSARSTTWLEIRYEAGRLGIAEGGAVFLQTSPFWGWSTPQVVDPGLPGYTEVTTEAEGVRLDPRTVGQGLLAIHVTGRTLEPGERITIRHEATVDDFAEERSPLWLAVDGDGDGVRGLVLPPPAVHVTAGEPARLVVTLPSVARGGEPVHARVAVLDRWGNTGVAVTGDLQLELTSGVADLGPLPRLEAGHRGVVTLQIVPRGDEVLRLRVMAPGGLETTSNPMVVSEQAPEILWGDLHGHSQLSDGTGTPDGWYRYARDVAGLDVAALTDHDHWGMRPLDATPELWREIREAAARYHAPGRFVTLLGYEWTSWIHGHRHVLYFDDRGDVYSSLDPDTDDPRELWQALRGKPALTVAHHSAGGPVATNWEIPPDPELEPITEVVSVHGASEAPDAPSPIGSPVPGNFVRDALGRGYRLGFVGSGDGHDGHPGLAHLGGGSGGLVALVGAERSRAGVLETLRQRRTYATNGPRIVLRAALDEHPMGSVVPAADEASLVVMVATRVPIDGLDVVRGDRVVDRLDGRGRLELTGAWRLPRLASGEFVYVRVVQEDGGAAWSSPFFVQ